MVYLPLEITNMIYKHIYYNIFSNVLKDIRHITIPIYKGFNGYGFNLLEKDNNIYITHCDKKSIIYEQLKTKVNYKLIGINHIYLKKYNISDINKLLLKFGYENTMVYLKIKL